MDLNKLANLLVPDENVRPLDYYEELYPERNLPKGAEVTRLAPSPTGFMHLGNLYVRSPTNGSRIKAAAYFICA